LGRKGRFSLRLENQIADIVSKLRISRLITNLLTSVVNNVNKQCKDL
jgi:hypothetical protein